MMREEREENKKTIKISPVHTLPNMRLHYSSMPNNLAFRISHVRDFLVFGVPNVKYLAFDTSDASAFKQVS